MYQKRKYVTIIAILLFVVWSFFGCAKGNQNTSMNKQGTKGQENNQYQENPIVMQNEEISVRVTYGLQGVITSNVELPVKMEIENTGEDFKGTAVVTLPDIKQKKGISYEKDVEIPSGETKTISILVPELGNFDTFQVALQKNGQEVLKQKISIELPYYNTSGGVLVGVLSEHPELLEYVNELVLDNSYSSTIQTVFLNLDSFPEETDTLNMMSFLIVDQVPEEQLSQKQREALKEWIQSGGVLILGGGSKSQEVLSILGENDLEYEVETIKNIALADAETTSKKISVESAIVKIKDAVLVKNLDDEIQTWKVEQGKGAIVFNSCMLGSESFNDWSKKGEFVAALLKNTMSDTTKEQLKNNYINNSFNDNIEQALDFYGDIKIPKTGFYIALFTIYILLIGPVGYFYLKRKDKREFIWLFVPVTVCIFYFILFIVNKDSNITEPVGTSITMIDSSSKNWKEQVYVSIMNPNKQAYEVSFSKNCQLVMPLKTPDYKWNYGDKYDLDVSRYAIKSTENQTTVTFQNGKAFSKDIFTMEAKEKKQTRGFEKHLTFTKDGISGSITNQTGYSIEEAGIVYNGMYVFLGDIGAGETVSIQPENTQIIRNKYANAIGELLTSNMLRQTREERSKKYQFQQLYTFFGGTLEESKTGEGYVFGIIEQYDKQYIENSSVQEHGRALVYDSIDQVSEKDGEYYVQNIMENVVFDQNKNIDFKSNVLYGEEDELEFSFDHAYEIQEIRCSNLTKEQLYQDVGLSIYAWNYQTKKYEKVFDTKKKLTGAELQKFVSKHKIRLRFECEASATLPIISVVGGENDAGN